MEVPDLVSRSEFAHIASPLMISKVAQSAWLHSASVRPGLQRVASELAIASATVVPGPQRESSDWPDWPRHRQALRRRLSNFASAFSHLSFAWPGCGWSSSHRSETVWTSEKVQELFTQPTPACVKKAPECGPLQRRFQ